LAANVNSSLNVGTARLAMTSQVIVLLAVQMTDGALVVYSVSRTQDTVN